MSVEERAARVLLAMETSGDVCGVAVLRDGVFIAEHTFRHGMHLSERLMGHVEAVLQDADATLADVDTFAVGIGPGSFTGTRIGVMTIKTLAAVLQKPIGGIGSLDALAAEYSGLAGVLIVPILPCKAGVVYACPYDVATETPLALAEAAAFPLAELVAMLVGLEPNRVLFCGAAVGRYRSDLSELLREVPFACSFGTALIPRASQVARLAHQRFLTDTLAEDVMELVPLYISPPPISIPKQEIPVPKEN